MLEHADVEINEISWYDQSFSDADLILELPHSEPAIGICLHGYMHFAWLIQFPAGADYIIDMIVSTRTWASSIRNHSHPSQSRQVHVLQYSAMQVPYSHS